MAGYYYEYLQKAFQGNVLDNELKDLMKNYNTLTGGYLYLYYGAASSIPGVENFICHNDYYKIFDTLKDCDSKRIDIFLATPGGNGDSAREIGNFLQTKFEHINFVIAGEAKSAGTILAMCGDEISMTQTGCLGPIDAQIASPKGVYSAYDFVEWIEKKKADADQMRRQGIPPYLDPIDVTMISAINPGELEKAKHALEFGKEIVKDWLCKRKFRNWALTETRKITVTNQLREDRAQEIANKLANHALWRDHGRSIKQHEISDMLKINILDENSQLSDVVYRIHTICNLMCSAMGVFKILGDKNKLMINGIGMPQNVQNNPPVAQRPSVLSPEAQGNILNALCYLEQIKKAVSIDGVVPVQNKCIKCGADTQFLLSFTTKEDIIKKFKEQSGIFIPYGENKGRCNKCGNEMDFTDFRNLCNQIAIQG